MIDYCDLVEIPFQGPRYTWSSSINGLNPVEQRIDQAFGSTSWCLRYPRATVHHLPRVHSDHHPILLYSEAPIIHHTIQRPFRFLACWMEHHDFNNFITRNWLPAGEDIAATS